VKTNSGNRLLSNLDQRRKNFFVFYILGALFFLPLYLLGDFLFSLGVVSTLFNHTLLLCFIPYLAAVKLHYDLSTFTGPNRLLVALITVVPFLVLIFFFAILQVRYARSAVLSVSIVTFVLLFFSSRSILNKVRLNLYVLQPPAWEELLERFPHGLPTDPVISPMMNFPIFEINKQEGDFVSFDGVLLGEPALLATKDLEQLDRIKQVHIRLYTVSSLFEMLSKRLDIDAMKDPLWHPEGNLMLDFIKRLIDVFIILITLPFWLSLMFLVSVLVKISSPGPVFFTQTRTGQFGKPFTILKFRTMSNKNLDEPRYTCRNDPRVTRLGLFLRKTRLDELPQLFNVLAGSMSLIGPRPEQQRFVDDFAKQLPSYPYRHLVRPGISGWAQVMHGYASSQKDTLVKLSYDLYYVKHYSLSLDLLILMKTVRVVFTGFGAR
jgi:lipopolysaccharide/colanic/teichoic acid biosynthesis glycosyltransferase